MQAVLVRGRDPRLFERHAPDGWPVIKEGVTVQERQIIFSVPDFSKLRVNASVSASRWLTASSPAKRSRSEWKGYQVEMLTGVVRNVAPSPDLRFHPCNTARRFTATPDRDRESAARPAPRMPVMVDILVESLDEVLTVPIQAVVPADASNGDRVVVKLPDGSFEGRTVTLGKVQRQGCRGQEWTQERRAACCWSLSSC